MENTDTGEAIFYIRFEGQFDTVDKTEYFDKKKTLKDFFEWIKEAKKEAEKKLGSNIFIAEQNIFRS